MPVKLGLAAVGVVLAVMLMPASPAAAGDATVADDATLTLPDQPAGDDELQQASGSPPAAAADGSGSALPTTATLPAVVPPPTLQGGSVSTLGVAVTSTSISTLNATISNNDFHN